MTRKVNRYREKIRPAEVKRHYNRFRTITDSETMQGLEVLTTRYAWDIGRRPSHVEMQGKNEVHYYDEFFRMVYFDQASKRFYLTTKYTDGDPTNQDEKVNWDTILVPIDGTIWDCHEAQSEAEGLPVVKIECVNGYPMQATTTEGPIWDCMQEPEELAHVLKLDKKKRRSPRK